jgi:hypothetical protein
MRGVVIVVLSVVFAMSASPQTRRFSGGNFRPFPAPLGGRSGLGAPQTPGVGLNGLPSFSTRQFHFNCFDCRPIHTRRSPVFWPFFGGAVLPAYPFAYDEAAPPAYNPQSVPLDPSLGQELDRLKTEVNELKQERVADRYRTPPEAAPERVPAQPAEPQEPPTIVVLRDGSKLEVRNYAVMGRTFWDFSVRPAKQVPISDIDIAASQRANEAQGTEFPQLTIPNKK